MATATPLVTAVTDTKSEADNLTISTLAISVADLVSGSGKSNAPTLHPSCTRRAPDAQPVWNLCCTQRLPTYLTDRVHRLKMTWIDLLTMAAMGAIGLGVYKAHPAPSRSFPVTFLDGEVVYPEFAYPLRHEIVPIWLAALLGSLIPIFVILCMQIRIRSFWDVNNAITGLLYSLIGAAVFQVFIKWLIGGLRPHFLAVCDPDPALLQAGGGGFRNIMFQRNICRGNVNQIDDSLESMPSGHTTAAFGGFLYLYFYLNAKLKVFSNHRPAFWKLIATYAPLLGACLIGGALTIDEYHNWYDVFAGAVIGSIFAISSYRMVYASVWDFRFNHIPLARHTPFSYDAGAAGAGGFESAVFTRQAGWGHEDHYGGAPFDAAHGLRAQTAGFNTGAVEQDGYMNKPEDDIEMNAGLHGNYGYTNGGSSAAMPAGHHHTSSIGRKPVGTQV